MLQVDAWSSTFSGRLVPSPKSSRKHFYDPSTRKSKQGNLEKVILRSLPGNVVRVRTGTTYMTNLGNLYFSNFPRVFLSRTVLLWK